MDFQYYGFDEKSELGQRANALFKAEKYVDNSDIITYKVERKDLTEWIQTRIQEIENAKVNKETPKGEPNGLCQFCKYQTKCFNEGNGIEHAPLSTPKKQENPEND